MQDAAWFNDARVYYIVIGVKPLSVYRYEPGMPKEREMLRYIRLADAELLDEGFHRHLLFPEKIQNFQALRIR